MKKKICIVTGSRAEYGLFRPLMDRIKIDKRYTLQLIVTGSHLSEQFGNTHKEIIKDKFKINSKVNIKANAGDSLEVSLAAGEAVIGISKSLEKLKPDLVFLLGDRYEMLAAAFASHLMSVPIAHIHGGEITEGSLDDAMRHAITKLSLLHFTSTETYRKRVIQMGEAPGRVFNVGSLGVENCKRTKLLGMKELEKSLGISFNHPFAIVTLHPATKEKIDTSKQVKALITALKRFAELQLIITYPNADSGSKLIIDHMEQFAGSRPNVHIFKNLGTLNYLSLLKFADVVIGNSSSGIIEVPSFGIPTVNIGERQKSRLAAKSVINSLATEAGIYNAIKKAMQPSFRSLSKKTLNPYDNGLASRNILLALHQFKNFRTIEKKFSDR